MSSLIPTPYAVICQGEGPGLEGCGQVFLTKEEYTKQMSNPNQTWRCPNCRREAQWDDSNYEKYLPPATEEDLA